ncbi:M23 family metallopeptidase [Tuberibacillus sp. Marseille-P3662]|uniref:M23 family metallopeptidase n=1 Tax=Tuberibacillus sp. Marseille-P3662 TaxID=1965358 RepID=UPI00159483E9|nr:M23 family metallopeptidase [Tuberibacillus sp. Marseille-P3662]
MSKIDDIRQRHAARKKGIKSFSGRQSETIKSHGTSSQRPDHDLNSVHPLFRTQSFIIKCMIAIVLILVVAIIDKQQGATFDQTKHVVQQTLNRDVNFTKLSSWYEDTFGSSPVAFFPSLTDQDQAKKTTGQGAKKQEADYAVPVSGQVSESFSTQTNGILMATKPGSAVTAVKSGTVISIENKEGIGKTVIIQHNNAESWYGKMDGVKVKPYEFVQQGQKIGSVKKDQDQERGTFYFALKNGDHFVDPIQVISFD